MTEIWLDLGVQDGWLEMGRNCVGAAEAVP
jgi:hypothetical protein